MRLRWLLLISLLLLGTLGLFLARSVPAPLSFEGFTPLFSQTEKSSGRASESAPVSERRVTILFGGDLMFDRWIRTVVGRQGGEYIFASLEATLKKADLVVANLEGPITENQSVSETSVAGSHDNYIFTFPPETAKLLRTENIGLVNIGNNHILNFKEDGVNQTKSFLEKAGMGYFGSPLADDERTIIREFSGTRIAFVNYNQFVLAGREKALADISAVKDQADFIVVYAHWGKEYEGVLPAVKDLAHAFIDAGADLIIGSHPHIVQDKEEYKGKMIYYSLGNLVFDQYFLPETQEGLLVQADFDVMNHTISTKEIPLQLHRSGQTTPREH